MELLSAAILAAEEAEKSQLPFIVAGALLAVFAVLISVLGFMRPDFPRSSGAARGVMALSVVLVAAAMFSAVFTS